MRRSRVTARLQDHLQLRHRHLLLLVLEDMGCAQQPLALYTPTGEQCTMIAFRAYLMETLIQFSLLISFSSYLNLRVYQ